MVAAILVEGIVSHGENLITALTSAGLRPNMAFWQHLHEEETWRLYLVYADVDTAGPIAVLTRIQPIIPLDDISVIGPSDKRVKHFRAALKRGIDQRGVRFRGPARDVGYIEDAFIYRL